MKKFKSIILLAISISFFSCEDSYKIVQDGEFGEDVTFQSVSDMQDFLTGTYAQASIRPEIALTSIFTDETGIGTADTGQNVALFAFVLNSNDEYATAAWLNNYRLINYANRLLRGAERIVPDATVIPDPNYKDASGVAYNEVQIYNSILAQARALRAFGHFQLMSFFAEDMKNDGSMGVILLDRVPAVDEELPRSTTGEVFAFIESDLQFAEANLIDPIRGTLSGASFPGVRKAHNYISANFTHALKARMYAYRGNYALAEQNADWVIANSGLALTQAGTLTGTTNGTINTAFYVNGTLSPYRKMFKDSEQGEILFSLARPIGQESIASIFYTNSSQLSGAPLLDMGRNLFNLLADQNKDGVVTSPIAARTAPTSVGDQDIRAKAFIDPTSIIAANPATVNPYESGDQLLIDKYPGITGAVLTNDLKVFRLSEMYLIKAEARASAQDLGSVATILKQIRDARTFAYVTTNAPIVNQPALPQPLPVYAGATEAWADILLERRKELCFEGHRYVDLRRLGPLAGTTIDRYYRDCDENGLTECSLPITDHRFVLPIPQSENIGNSVIQQNPGY